MERVKEQFFGRERLMREIVAGVLATPQPASVSLVGSKLAGKSRLLAHLASPQGPLQNPDQTEWRPSPFQTAQRVLVLLIDCDWHEARSDLPGHIADRLADLLAQAEQTGLAWEQVEAQSGARRIGQMSRQISQRGYRLVLLLDNFDILFEQELLTPDTIAALRPLARQVGLVVATEQPLHDLDRDLAASPLFNVMTQLFIGLLEPEAARQWLAAYRARFPAMAQIEESLLQWAGNHPYLLYRLDDILSEVQWMLGPDGRICAEELPLVRLRLAEHGRPLFVTFWNTLHNPPRRIDPARLMGVVERLVAGKVRADQVERNQISILNWLINQGMVIYSQQSYRLFSPLFGEFLANRLARAASIAARTVPAPAPSTHDALYTQLTKTESALLRYFQSHSYTVVTPEQLLADVWKRPDASPRRVQEAIRRLRLELAQASPPIGAIENERGQGYRFIPAAT